MRTKNIIMICFVMALALMAIGTAAAEINVNPGDSIQTAINGADPGDTIIVHFGVYTENVDVDKELTIKSSSHAVVQAASSADHVFNVTADNVIISGFTITGANDWPYSGIYLDDVEECIVTNNIASNNAFGIGLNGSNNNELSNNYASNNDYGIWLVSSSNNELSNNYASNNADGIRLDSSSNNNTLSNNYASNNYDGIRLDSSSNNNTLSDNYASDNLRGIWLLLSSNNNTLSNNYASNNDDGILLYSSSNNELSNNYASNNLRGIRLSSSNNNELSNNYASDNDYGIYLESSSNNDIYNNYFNNTNNTRFFGTNIGNVWNSTEMLYTYNNSIYVNYTGNYYHDYTSAPTNGFDANLDGIGDIPYVDNGDNYPLMSWPLADYVEADININDIDTKSKSVTAYIQLLPDSYSVEDIDMGTVTLTSDDLFDSPLSAVGKSKIGDYDKDGVPDLKVEFDVSGLTPHPVGTYVCTLTGEVDGQKFKGTDIITVLTKGKT